MKEVLRLVIMGEPRPWTHSTTSFFFKNGARRPKPVSYSEHKEIKDAMREQIRKQLPPDWVLLTGKLGRQVQYFFSLTPTRVKQGFQMGDYFTKKPDDTNLDKLVEDAMTGLVYIDDQQLCRRPGDDFKKIGDPPRTEIILYEWE